MIRQAINCDICGAEKLETTSHWFVAYEQGGELKLRGWESPKNSRKNVKHLCGQKCVQHLTANFMAAVMGGGYAAKSAKEEMLESLEQHVDDDYDQDETPILERMGYNRETAALIEAESWAGPAKPKVSTLEPVSKQKIGRETLVNAARLKVQTARPYQHMA
jgi:hypothetical protein